jgi:hypothetical protein
VSVLAGDPAAMRSTAARLRAEAADARTSLSRTSVHTEFPVSRGAAVERSRETAAALRERSAWISDRLETLALELDRGADWLEEAQAAALAVGETW